MNQKSNNTQYQTSDHFVLREIAGEHLLIPVNDAGKLNHTMISLNPTCLAIWKSYQKPRTLSETVRALRQIYAGDPEEMEKDITQFTSEALYYGLLKEVI